jgi:hypothetical protein
LFIVLSLFTLYLFMVGCVLASFSRSKGGLLEQAGLAIAIGILINYCLMLTGLTITRVLVVGLILALWGGWKFSTALRMGLAQASMFSVGCVICILVVYYFKILSEPLEHSDARSIWFFHARMIWTEGALSRSAGWNHPSIVGFTNPDYPKLVPALAAQLAYVKGYWNEFLPKGSLLLMLVPLTLWVFSFYQKSLSFLLLVLTFFSSLGIFLWVGYMDGYLAMYSAAALLLFGRYFSERRDADLYSGMCALGIGANLKYEGLLFGVCAITALLFIGPGHPEFRLSRFATRIRMDPMFAKVLVLSIAPTLMWAICKRAWGLQSDLARDPSNGFARFWTRLFDGFSPLYALNYLTVRATAIWLVIGIFAITVMFCLHQRLKLHRGALVAAATSALYFCGLYFVYLSTPHDILHSYLSTAGTRTMMTAGMGLLIGIFFLLSSLEVHEGSAP